MVAAIKQLVTVQPGGVIELRSPELPPGAQAEVIVLIEDASSPQSTWADFIGSGKGAFKSVEEIDAYIRDIRDWGERDR